MHHCQNERIHLQKYKNYLYYLSFREKNCKKVEEKKEMGADKSHLLPSVFVNLQPYSTDCQKVRPTGADGADKKQKIILYLYYNSNLNYLNII